MRRLLLTSVALAILLSLGACGGSSATFKASSNTLGCQPQELFNVMNSLVAYNNEKEDKQWTLFEMPKYEDSGEIEISGSMLTVDVDTNPSGVLTKLTFKCWPNGEPQLSVVAYLYATALAYAASSDDMPDVTGDFADAMEGKSPNKTVTYDGVAYTFDCSRASQYVVTIAPATQS